MSRQQQLLKQELTISQILANTENNLGRSKNDIMMDITGDVLSVSSCHILVGMVKMILMLEENYWVH